MMSLFMADTVVLRLLAFDNKDQPLPHDHPENHLICVDSTRVIPLGFV
jgi:hypothetical protein